MKVNVYLHTKCRWDISIHGRVITTSGFWKGTFVMFEFYFRFWFWIFDLVIGMADCIGNCKFNRNNCFFSILLKLLKCQIVIITNNYKTCNVLFATLINDVIYPYLYHFQFRNRQIQSYRLCSENHNRKSPQRQQRQITRVQSCSSWEVSERCESLMSEMCCRETFVVAVKHRRVC